MAEVENKMEELQNPLRYYFGSNHPFFTEVCDILVTLHEQYGNYESAVSYGRTSLANMIQLCGGNNMHIKLAGNFYQIGECLLKWGRIDEAISNFKKAKNVLEFNEYTTDR